MILRICDLLQSCTTDAPFFPATELYNEGWLLRLVLDWFSRNKVSDHPLSFPEKARWFSEAWLPSAFLARHARDPLAESWTHLDGVIGHFEVGKEGKADLSLLPDADHFVVVEAKLFSGLAPSVTNAKYFDQAARTVACIAEVLRRADRHPSDLSHLGFYVLAPQVQIDGGVFAERMDYYSIGEKVERRVAEYAGAKDQWHSDWFQPTLQRIELGIVSWEHLVESIHQHDSMFADSSKKFYGRCVRFNQAPDTVVA